MNIFTWLGNLLKKPGNDTLNAAKPAMKAAVDKAIGDVLIVGVESGEKAIPLVTTAVIGYAKKAKVPDFAIGILTTLLGTYLSDLIGKTGGTVAATLQNIGDKLKKAIDGARF